MTRAPKALVWCLLGLVGGCALPSSPQSHTDRATLAACRDYASRVYDETNRGAIYSINNQAAAPNSGTYLRDYGTGTLAAQYHNDQIIDDCVRNTGTETNRQDTSAPTAAPTAAPTVAPIAAPPAAPP